MNKLLISGLMVVVLAIGGWFVFSDNQNEDLDSDDAMEQKATATPSFTTTPSVTSSPEAMMKTGSYETYAPEKLALADKGKVVLFFRASWCPTCKALDADIRANLSKIPAGTVILDVDYDKYTDLKKKYNVTYQHTLVQVDASGNQIAKWSGSPTLSSILDKVR